MADSIPHPKSIRLPTNSKPNSHSHFLFKALFFALFLLLLPLFPSEAPDFLSQTVLTKFWELLHLLFIGIAVSYGLFSRRVYNRPNFDSQEVVSGGGFHVASIFDNNPSGFDEKYGDYGGEYAIPFSSQDGYEFSYGKGENVTVQGWNSQYFQGESNVVVAQPNPDFDFQYKPLGLPVRNLRSIVNSQNGSSCSVMKSLSSNCSDKSRNGNFGDLGSVNLDEKSKETTIPMPSPIPWRSRSGRMERREKSGAFSSRPSHFRPQSVDETQFETLKTRSFGSSTHSYSYQSSSSSHSPNRVSPSHSTSLEEHSSGGEDCVQDESPPHSSFLASSQSPPMKGKAPLNSLHSSQKSYACFFENDVKEKLHYNDMDDTRDGYGFEERGRNLSNHSGHCSNGSSSEKELERSFNNHSRYSSNGTSFEKELEGIINNHSRHGSGGTSSEKELERNYYNHSRHSSNGTSSEKELERDLGNHSRHCSNGSSSEKELERNFNNNSRHCSNGSSSEKELERNFNNNSRHCSNGSSFEKELEKNFNGSLNNLGLQRKENSLKGMEMGMKSSNKKLQISSNDEMRDLDEKKRVYWLHRKEGKRIDSSNQEMKPENGLKASLKGKSVRTFRGSCYAKETSEFGDRFENEVNGNQQKREKQEVNEKVSEDDKKEKSIEKVETLETSSDEEVKPLSNSNVNNAGTDLDEVDKKAGEFIAKFREQIRLQKVDSFRKSRGLRVKW